MRPRRYRYNAVEVSTPRSRLVRDSGGDDGPIDGAEQPLADLVENDSQSFGDADPEENGRDAA